VTNTKFKNLFSTNCLPQEDMLSSIEIVTQNVVFSNLQMVYFVKGAGIIVQLV
jgi:hypothetical protein